jgi:hypothetical protein
MKLKKTMLAAGVLFFVASSLSSCKKDYKCSCTKTYTSGTTTTSKDYSEYTYKDTRNRAENRCNDNTSTGTDLGGNYAVNCEIIPK